MGFVLLISGWALVLAALVLLSGVGLRLAFVFAGIAVELLGLHLFGSTYKELQSRPKRRETQR